MELVMKIDKVGGVFHHRPNASDVDRSYVERRARKCGFYGEDWVLERATECELVFVRNKERSIVRYEIKEA